MGDLRTGKIKWWSTGRGFGFIVDDQDHLDVFLHIDIIKDTGIVMLREGQSVEYLRENNAGRLRATFVTINSANTGIVRELMERASQLSAGDADSRADAMLMINAAQAIATEGASHG